MFGKNGLESLKHNELHPQINWTRSIWYVNPCSNYECVVFFISRFVVNFNLYIKLHQTDDQPWKKKCSAFIPSNSRMSNVFYIKLCKAIIHREGDSEYETSKNQREFWFELQACNNRIDSFNRINSWMNIFIMILFIWTHLTVCIWMQFQNALLWCWKKKSPSKLSRKKSLLLENDFKCSNFNLKSGIKNFVLFILLK